jgi:trans-aconitate methyltransferase
MINFDSVDSCPICNSKDTNNFIDFKDCFQFIESYKAFKMNKDICNLCGHIYVSSCHDYDIEGHYETARGRGDLIYSKSSQIVQDEFIDLVNWLDDSISDPDSVLDIGCGKCELLNAFKIKYKSSDVHGIDYSKDSIEYGKLYNLHSIISGDLYENLPRKANFDVVSATGVLEHQYDLDTFLARMKSLGSNDASFLIQVPDSYSIFGREDLGSKYMHDLFNDEHLHHFNTENLFNLLNKNGFEVIKYRTNRRNDWDLIDVLFKVSDSQITPALTSENQNVSKDFLSKFNKKRLNDQSRLKDLINDAASLGIYGGGWHTDVCLPAYYEFSFEKVKAIFDLDKRKQGNQLFGIEVLEPTKDAIEALDMIIISSINLNQDIIDFLVGMGVSRKKIVSIY